MARHGECSTTAMARKSRLEPWTIPFHVIMWATLLCGLIMTIVVVMLHS
jgi:hypothetical protein